MMFVIIAYPLCFLFLDMISAKKKLTGVRITSRTDIYGAENIAKLSGTSLAILFGMISPKVSTTTVITTVEIATPFFGK